jgi:cytochrome P450
VVGCALALRRDPVGFLTRVARECGEIGAFRLGLHRGVLVNAPELARQVLVEGAGAYDKGERQRRALRPLLGEGLLVSEGELHQRQRKLIAPAFTAPRIARYANTMVAHADRVQREWAEGATLELQAAMTRLTMRIVGDVLLSAEVSDEEEIGAAITTAFEWEMYAMTRLFPLPYAVPSPRRRRTARALAVLRRRLLPLIAARRARDVDAGDLLSVLLRARDADGRAMDEAQVYDEVVTICGAALETSADALCWSLYLLARHPPCYAALQEEVDRVLGGRLPTHADLPDLPYALLVFKEALRLYPPAAVIMRGAVCDTALGEHVIRQGDVLLVAPYTLHRRPDVYPDPERFEPERFLPHRERALPRCAYLPFGAGSRSCIGNHFAMMEAQLLLAVFAQAVRFELGPEQRAVPELLINLRPKGGIAVRVRRRADQPGRSLPVVAGRQAPGETGGSAGARERW